MKIISFYVVPVLWLASFFFSVPLVEPYEISRLIALAAGVAALGVVLADPQKREVNIAVTPLVLLLAGFLLWCGFTFFWSVSPFVTVIAWGGLCLLPLWFMVFALLPVTPEQIMLTLRLSVLSLVLLALWALVQYCVLPEFLTTYGTIRHPFADPNNYAALLNMGLFAALGLSFYTNSRTERLLMLLSAVVMMIAIVLIGSRMAMIVSVLALIVFGALTFRSTPSHFKIVGSILLVGVLTLLTTALFNDDRITSIMRAGDLLNLANDKSLSARLMIWSSSWELVKQYGLLGAGLGSFFLIYPSVRSAAETSSSGLMAHADPLQFWIETGLPGVALLYATLLMILVGFIKYLRSPNHNAQQRLFVVGLFCSLLTLALHMHVSFHLYIPALLTLTGLLLAVLIKHMMPGKSLIVCRSKVLIADLILLSAFLVVLHSCLMSEMHTRYALRSLEHGDMPSFGNLINQAGEEGFKLNPRPYVLAATIPIGLLQTTMDPAAREDLFHQAEGLLDQGLARSSVSASAYYSKALLYEAMGQKDESLQYLEKALKIEPQHLQARAMAGR